jgi:hypothetical protein
MEGSKREAARNDDDPRREGRAKADTLGNKREAAKRGGNFNFITVDV